MRIRNIICEFSILDPTPMVQGHSAEAMARGYAFDQSKINPARKAVSLTVTTGQMVYEWEHLLAKLKVRNPVLYQKWRNTEVPEVHPMFTVRAGDVESWERC